jgi:hypothetical protein
MGDENNSEPRTRTSEPGTVPGLTPSPKSDIMLLEANVGLGGDILAENEGAQFRLSRLVRTVGSEIYVIWDGDTRVGQVHLHYSHDIIHAALLLEIELQVHDEEALLEMIDEDIVSSYLPSFEREDFLVTIYRAEEISSFSFASNDMDALDSDDDEDL